VLRIPVPSPRRYSPRWPSGVRASHAPPSSAIMPLRIPNREYHPALS